MPARIAVIDRELCIKERCGYVCSKVCPPNRMGEECIVVDDETKFPVISESMTELKRQGFAVIIDEAHSSQ